MDKILVSACLIGEAVRYDGGSCLQGGVLAQWQEQERLVPHCPEVAGGLPVPRPAAEIQPDGRVITIAGEDVGSAFDEGARAALNLCREHNIRIAILKEGSPSCGVHKINDGSFNRKKISGRGITSRLLEAHGVRVYSEDELDAVTALMNSNT